MYVTLDVILIISPDDDEEEKEEPRTSNLLEPRTKKGACSGRT